MFRKAMTPLPFPAIGLTSKGELTLAANPTPVLGARRMAKAELLHGAVLAVHDVFAHLRGTGEPVMATTILLWCEWLSTRPLESIPNPPRLLLELIRQPKRTTHGHDTRHFDRRV